MKFCLSHLQNKFNCRWCHRIKGSSWIKNYFPVWEQAGCQSRRFSFITLSACMLSDTTSRKTIIWAGAAMQKKAKACCVGSYVPLFQIPKFIKKKDNEIHQSPKHILTINQPTNLEHFGNEKWCKYSLLCTYNKHSFLDLQEEDALRCGIPIIMPFCQSRFSELFQETKTVDCQCSYYRRLKLSRSEIKYRSC